MQPKNDRFGRGSSLQTNYCVSFQGCLRGEILRFNHLATLLLCLWREGRRSFSPTARWPQRGFSKQTTLCTLDLLGNGGKNQENSPNAGEQW